MSTSFNPTGTVFDSSSTAPKRTGRGFAGMDPAKQREIASQGGRAAHASGNAHQFTSEEARAAGQKRHKRGGPTRAGIYTGPAEAFGDRGVDSSDGSAT